MPRGSPVIAGVQGVQRAASDLGAAAERLLADGRLPAALEEGAHHRMRVSVYFRSRRTVRVQSEVVAQAANGDA
jgi:hypothetical protein